MKRKDRIIGIGAAVGMLLLILDGKTAVTGAQEGVELCIRTVVPSLFPFFVLSILLTGSLSGMHAAFIRPLGKFCRIPSGSESILLTGFLGGYPVGAQCVSTAFASGQLSRAQAQRMLYFCSNAGPAFLFGIIASQFPHTLYAWLLWGIHMLSALLVARTIPPVDDTPAKPIAGSPSSMTGALGKSITVMATVCGWVILFRVIIAFAERWFLWLLPTEVQVLITGLLELANGCCSLKAVEHIGLRLTLCSVMLAFGGLCVTMQTVSLLSGLEWKPYMLGKLLQSLYSLILSTLVQFLLPPDQRWLSHRECIAVACFLSVLLLLMRKRQKKSSVSTALRV